MKSFIGAALITTMTTVPSLAGCKLTEDIWAWNSKTRLLSILKAAYLGGA